MHSGSNKKTSHASSLKDTPPHSRLVAALLCATRTWGQFLGADFDKLGRFTWLCMVKSVSFHPLFKRWGILNMKWCFMNLSKQYSGMNIHTHTHTPQIDWKFHHPPPEKKYLISFCQKKVRSFALHGKKRYQYHSDINCLGTNFLWVYPVINYFLELHFLELHSNVGVDIPFNPRIMDGKTG